MTAGSDHMLAEIRRRKYKDVELIKQAPPPLAAKQKEFIEHVEKWGGMYLGGSRRMAQLAIDIYKGSDQWYSYYSNMMVGIRVSPETDYDFYTTHSKAKVSKLMDLGFSPSETEYEYDDEAVEILCNNALNIQVVLRRDAEFYKNVFENIDLDFYYHFLWKSSPAFDGNAGKIQPIFNQLFQIAHTFDTYPR